MEQLSNVIKSVETSYQFFAFIILAIMVLIKWLVVDAKKNRTFIEIKKRLQDLVNMLSGQDKLLTILIRRYSDDLSNEQLSPFVNWMYQSFEFSFFVKFIKIQKLLKNHDISEDEAKTVFREDVENIGSEFYQWLSLFKYKGKNLCQYWQKDDITNIYDSCVNELGRGVNAERTIEQFDRIVRKKIVKMVDKIVNDESVNS